MRPACVVLLDALDDSAARRRAIPAELGRRSGKRERKVVRRLYENEIKEQRELSLSTLQQLSPVSALR